MKKLFILLLVPLFSLSAYAQDDFIEPKDSLQNLIDNLDNQYRSIRIEYTTEKERLAKAIKEYEELKSKYVARDLGKMNAERDSLQASIERQNVEIAELEARIAAANKRIDELAKTKSELEEGRNTSVKAKIDQHKAELEKPLSEMTLVGLEKIADDCRPYDSTLAMKKFLKEIDMYKTYLTIYNDARIVLNSKYDKTNVDNIISNLETIKSNLNEVQVADVDNVLTNLRKFGEGVAVLKEYMSMIGDKRKSAAGYYSSDDFKDDLAVFDTVEMKRRIAEFVTPIPYLARALEEYKKSMIENPNKVSAIEKEIMGS